MDFSELLTPQDVTGRLLVAVFGPAAAIVTIVLLAKVVASWPGAAPSVVSIDLDSETTDLTAYRAVMRRRWPALTTAVVVTALLVVVQVVWLWSASQIAHGLSYLWHAPLGTGRVDLNGLTSHDDWDWLSASYLSASVVVLVAAYASAFRSGQRDVIGGGAVLLALPLILPWGLFCLVGSLFALVMAVIRWFHDGSPRLADDGRAFIVVTLVVTAYTILLYMTLRTTRTVAGSWDQA